MPLRFQQLLKRTMGLDTESVGPSVVSRAVEQRARLYAADDLDTYWDKVLRDDRELQALVEDVVVPETWFYRDPKAFVAMASMLRDAWATSQSTEPLRLLSLPCSTGEEPYTMALALLEAGVPSAAFRIVGMDISNRALERARAGIYGRNSFRGTDIAYRDRHFTEVADGYRLSDEVRSSVQFCQGNVFELDKLGTGSFDVVFCRNLLIYFDPPDQRRALGGLSRLLAPKGNLFVGHSETRAAVEEGFVPLGISHAFAFRKGGAPAKPMKPASLPAGPLAKALIRRPARPVDSRAAAVAKFVSRRMPPAPLSVAACVNLADIRRAADRGDLKTASALGATLLKKGEVTAEELHLLAVISDASGDAVAAAEYYRKALYLDPNHHEALTHLAILLEAAGDAAGGRRMRDRAQRIDKRRGQ